MVVEYRQVRIFLPHNRKRKLNRTLFREMGLTEYGSASVTSAPERQQSVTECEVYELQTKGLYDKRGKPKSPREIAKRAGITDAEEMIVLGELKSKIIPPTPKQQCIKSAVRNPFSIRYCVAKGSNVCFGGCGVVPEERSPEMNVNMIGVVPMGKDISEELSDYFQGHVLRARFPMYRGIKDGRSIPRSDRYMVIFRDDEHKEPTQQDVIHALSDQFNDDFAVSFETFYGSF